MPEKMMRITNWCKHKSELDFMKLHLDKKGVAWEIYKNGNGQYAIYRKYKPIGRVKPPEPLPNRKAWDER